MAASNPRLAFRRFQRLVRPAADRELIEQRFLRLARAPNVQTLIHDDPVDPAEELVRRVEALEVCVRTNESVLRRVPRVFMIADQPESDREQDALIPRDERLEGGRISP